MGRSPAWLLLFFTLALPPSIGRACSLEENCSTVTNFTSNDFCKNSDSVVPPTIVEILEEPQGGKWQSGKFISLHCAFIAVSSHSTTPFIAWEHNGVVLNDTCPEFDITFPSDTNSSLSFNLSAETEGSYRCKVVDGNYSIVSHEAKLKQLSSSSWIDTASYPPQPSNKDVSLAVTQGGSVVLECHLDTTEPIEHIFWTRNNAEINCSQNSSLTQEAVVCVSSSVLLLRSVPALNKWSVMYICTVLLEKMSPSRTFRITVRDEAEAPPKSVKMSVAPRDQIVAPGNAVNLYCIAEASPQPALVWLKDGAPIGEEGMGGVQDFGEVLSFEGFSSERQGAYTCVASTEYNAVNATAQLAILTSANLSMLGDTSGTQSDIFVTSANFSLTCEPDTSLLSPALVQFQWFFRGEMISESSADFMITQTQNGRRLSVCGSTVLDVVGTYQCFVVSLMDTVVANTRILPLANVNPPEFLNVIRDINFKFFTYRLNWGQTLEPYNRTIHEYSVEVFVNDLLMLCSCSVPIVHSRTAYFNAQAQYYDKTLYFRVAAVNGYGLSNYATYGCEANEKTASHFIAPPKPILLDNVAVAHSAMHSWTVTLRWQLPNDNVYPRKFYTTTIAVECEGRPRENKEINRSSYTVTRIPCCTSCHWSLTLDTAESIGDRQRLPGLNFTSFAESSFVTGVLIPDQVAQLHSVDRIGTDGKTVNLSFTLPSKSISCGANNLLVRCENTSHNKTISYIPKLGSEDSHIVVMPIDCWMQCNVSVAYANLAGVSNFSNILPLREFNKNDIHFSGLSVTPNTSTALLVSWKTDPGTACLMNTGRVSGSICYVETVGNCSRKKGFCDHQKKIPPDAVNYTIKGLRPARSYCVYLKVEYDWNDSVVSLDGLLPKTGLTNEDIPVCPPQNLTHLTNADKGLLEVRWTAPPEECRNGNIQNYRVNLNGEINTLTSLTKTFPYDPKISYNISVSACTSPGCGPIASEVINATSTPSNISPPGAPPMTVIIVSVATVGVIVMIMVIATTIVICCCVRNCSKKREHNFEQRDGLCENEVVLLRTDDLIDPDGSSYVPTSEHTEYQRLDGMEMEVGKQAVLNKFLDSITSEGHGQCKEQANEQEIKVDTRDRSISETTLEARQKVSAVVELNHAGNSTPDTTRRDVLEMELEPLPTSGYRESRFSSAPLHEDELESLPLIPSSLGPCNSKLRMPPQGATQGATHHSYPGLVEHPNRQIKSGVAAMNTATMRKGHSTTVNPLVEARGGYLPNDPVTAELSATHTSYSQQMQQTPQAHHTNVGLVSPSSHSAVLTRQQHICDGYVVEEHSNPTTRGQSADTAWVQSTDTAWVQSTDATQVLHSAPSNPEEKGFQWTSPNYRPLLPTDKTQVISSPPTPTRESLGSPMVDQSGYVRNPPDASVQDCPAIDHTLSGTGRPAYAEWRQSTPRSRTEELHRSRGGDKITMKSSSCGYVQEENYPPAVVTDTPIASGALDLSSYDGGFDFTPMNEFHASKDSDFDSVFDESVPPPSRRLSAPNLNSGPPQVKNTHYLSRRASAYTASVPLHSLPRRMSSEGYCSGPGTPLSATVTRDPRSPGNLSSIDASSDDPVFIFNSKPSPAPMSRDSYVRRENRTLVPQGSHSVSSPMDPQTKESDSPLPPHHAHPQRHCKPHVNLPVCASGYVLDQTLEQVSDFRSSSQSNTGTHHTTSSLVSSPCSPERLGHEPFSLDRRPSLPQSPVTTYNMPVARLEGPSIVTLTHPQSISGYPFPETRFLPKIGGSSENQTQSTFAASDVSRSPNGSQHTPTIGSISKHHTHPSFTASDASMSPSDNQHAPTLGMGSGGYRIPDSELSERRVSTADSVGGHVKAPSGHIAPDGNTLEALPVHISRTTSKLHVASPSCSDRASDASVIPGKSAGYEDGRCSSCSADTSWQQPVRSTYTLPSLLGKPLCGKVPQSTFLPSHVPDTPDRSQLPLSPHQSAASPPIISPNFQALPLQRGDKSDPSSSDYCEISEVDLSLSMVPLNNTHSEDRTVSSERDISVRANLSTTHDDSLEGNLTRDTFPLRSACYNSQRKPKEREDSFVYADKETPYPQGVRSSSDTILTEQTVFHSTDCPAQNSGDIVLSSEASLPPQQGSGYISCNDVANVSHGVKAGKPRLDFDPAAMADELKFLSSAQFSPSDGSGYV